MNLINLTPHTVNLCDPEGNVLLSLPSEAVSARVSEHFELVDSVLFPVPLKRSLYGEVTGLPDPKPNTIYIVSMLVATASSRTDLVYPGELHRNSDGVIVGCKCLLVTNA